MTYGMSFILRVNSKVQPVTHMITIHNISYENETLQKTIHAHF